MNENITKTNLFEANDTINKTDKNKLNSLIKYGTFSSPLDSFFNTKDLLWKYTLEKASKGAIKSALSSNSIQPILSELTKTYIKMENKDLFPINAKELLHSVKFVVEGTSVFAKVNTNDLKCRKSVYLYQPRGIHNQIEIGGENDFTIQVQNDMNIYAGEAYILSIYFEDCDTRLSFEPVILNGKNGDKLMKVCCLQDNILSTVYLSEGYKEALDKFRG